MEQFCTVIWAALGTLTVVVAAGWSWALDNFGKLAAWWAGLSATVKALLYAASTLVIGAALWAAGRYGLGCAGWPNDMDIFYMIAVAVASWFTGGKRHAVAKTHELKAELTAAMEENNELRAEVTRLAVGE